MGEFTVRYCDSLHPSAVIGRICFNPNYGGRPTQVKGTCRIDLPRRVIKVDTRRSIRESVEEDGFRNPILVYATTSGILLAFGGGRLEAARQLDRELPAIVVDYVDGFDTFPEVTPDNWQEFFTDVPKYFEFTDVGVSTHYGLERGRREDLDEAGMEWARSNSRHMEAVLRESPWIDGEEG